MFARVSTFQGSPENIEKEIQIIKKEVVPKVRTLKGFKAFRMLVDRTSGKSMGFTIWETEEDMKASEQAANQLRKAGLSAGEKIVSVERYEIAIDERA
jgi:heme-degrading monooxygenase HmoA